MNRAGSLAVVLCSIALAAGPEAQTSARVRLETAGAAAALAARLEAGGYDVLHPTVGTRSLELIAGPAELQALRAAGHEPVVLARGRPYAAIQAEAAADGGVPGGYPDLAVIEGYLEALAAAHPDLCRAVDLTAELGAPPTFEGRPIRGLVVSDQVHVEEDEPAALLVSTHHARELITPVIALKAAEELVCLYGVDPAVTAIVDANEIWIVPVWNPDGYEHVFQVDNLWRKNRRPVDLGFASGIGVDLNRNYPFGWDNACSGSSLPDSSTYKGPSPASEAETQTMLALTAEQRFARVLDFHSSGQEVLWGYLCPSHPLEAYLLEEAVALSIACGYGGEERPPSADGEHYEWQLANTASHSFLVETGTGFQPPFELAAAEAEQVVDGIRAFLERPIPLWGHVTDACTGEPLAAALQFSGIVYPNGEQNLSGGLFGRYHAFLPAGDLVVQFEAPGYLGQAHPVSIPAGGSVQLDVALQPETVLSLSGAFQPGGVVSLALASASDAGAPYAAAVGLSGTVPGLPIGDCALPLNLDAAALLSLQGGPAFVGFSGVLDGAGLAAGSLALPPNPSLSGLEADLAFLTFDPSTLAPRHPSNAAHLVVAP